MKFSELIKGGSSYLEETMFSDHLFHHNLLINQSFNCTGCLFFKNYKLSKAQVSCKYFASTTYPFDTIALINLATQQSLTSISRSCTVTLSSNHFHKLLSYMNVFPVLNFSGMLLHVAISFLKVSYMKIFPCYRTLKNRPTNRYKRTDSVVYIQKLYL